jgi:P27 family predicted phage terminase small subunit
MKPPFRLSVPARAEWERLAQIGRLTEIEAVPLAMYCQAVAAFQWATETINREGYVRKRTDGVLAVHPAFEVKHAAMQEILDLARELGHDAGVARRSCPWLLKPGRGGR